MTTSITFDALAEISQRNGVWVAFIDPPGTTVYGDSEAEVRENIGTALELFADTLIGSIGEKRFLAYLADKPKQLRPAGNETLHLYLA